MGLLWTDYGEFERRDENGVLLQERQGLDLLIKRRGLFFPLMY
ncbi:MAG: hypothetical protein AB1595_06885 [bacterium]